MRPESVCELATRPGAPRRVARLLAVRWPLDFETDPKLARPCAGLASFQGRVAARTRFRESWSCSRSGDSAHRSSSTRAVVPPVLKHLPAHRPPRPRSPEHSQPQTHEQPLTRRESGSGAVIEPHKRREGRPTNDTTERHRHDQNRHSQHPEMGVNHPFRRFSRVMAHITSPGNANRRNGAAALRYAPVALVMRLPGSRGPSRRPTLPQASSRREQRRKTPQSGAMPEV